MKKPKIPSVRGRMLPSGNTMYMIDYYDPWTKKRVRQNVGEEEDDAHSEASRIYQQMVDRWNGFEVRELVMRTIYEVIEEFFSSKLGRIRDSSVRRYRIYLNNFQNFVSNKIPEVKNIEDLRKSHIEE